MDGGRHGKGEGEGNRTDGGASERGEVRDRGRWGGRWSETQGVGGVA